MVSPCGLDAGNSYPVGHLRLGIVAAADELLHHLRDPLNSKSSVDDGVFVFILVSEALEVFLEQELDSIDSPLLIDRLFDRSKLER